MEFYFNKIKLDSLAIHIPADECENNSVIGRENLMLVDGDEVLREGIKGLAFYPIGDKEKEYYDHVAFRMSRTMLFDGELEKTRDGKVKPISKEGFRIVVTAKMLRSERYFEGITHDNLRIIYDWLQGLKGGIKFSYDTFLNAKIEDVDFNIDVPATPEEWLKVCEHIETNTKMTARKYIVRSRQTSNPNKNVGLQFMDRNKTVGNKGPSPTRPHTKYYHKGLELVAKDKSIWAEKWLGLKEVLNIGRYELTLRNKDYFKYVDSPIKTLKDLLDELPNIGGKLKEYIMKSTRMNFLETRVVTKQKFDLSLRDSVTYNLIEFGVRQWGLTEEQVIEFITNVTDARGSQSIEKTRVMNYFLDMMRDIHNDPSLVAVAKQNKKVRELTQTLHLNI